MKTSSELVADHHELGVMLGGSVASGQWADADRIRADMRAVADQIRARLAERDAAIASLDAARNALSRVCDVLGADHVLGIEAGAIAAAEETATKLRAAYGEIDSLRDALDRACGRMLDGR